jgi:hypothetical protein
MREDGSLAIRRWELNAFATSFGRSLGHEIGIACDGYVPERFVENG